MRSARAAPNFEARLPPFCRGLSSKSQVRNAEAAADSPSQHDMSAWLLETGDGYPEPGRKPKMPTHRPFKPKP